MDCIYCGHKTSVVNSRPQKRLQQVWRRRRCSTCEAVFTSIESVELAGSLIVGSSKSRMEPFSRDKLYLSVWSTLGHRKDAISAANALTATIISLIRKTTNSPRIERSHIIQVATDVLARFDIASSVQYAAYHKP